MQTIRKNQQQIAHWQYNMLNRAAGGRAPPVPSLAEGSGAYEYIRGIHGYPYHGATYCSNSEFEK